MTEHRRTCNSFEYPFRISQGGGPVTHTWRVDVGRQGSVDANSHRAKVNGKRLRETDFSGLCLAEDSDHRGQVDDRPIRLSQVWQSMVAPGKGARQVEPNQPL